MEKGQELKLKPFLKPHIVNSQATWRTELPFLLLQALFPGISDTLPTCAQDKQATREQFQHLTSATSNTSSPFTPPHRFSLAGPAGSPHGTAQHEDSKLLHSTSLQNHSATPRHFNAFYETHSW